jgi:hypothetical protein
MNWRFCPHCETQLDEATGICPACRWDPLDVPPTAPAGPEVSLMERYRGTEYDSQQAQAAAMARHRRTPGPTPKAKLMLLVGVLVLFGLYGGMYAFSQLDDAGERHAPATVSVP